MKKKTRFRSIIFLIGLFLTVPLVLPAAAQDGVTTFDLKVSTDYHLNQDGRPTPSYDFLVPLYFDDESVLFFNPRYHVDDRTNLHQAEEWNLGLGYRKMIGDKAILGANVYYDWRRSMTGNQFEQVGAGVELLTENTTARVNGYLTLTGPEEVARWREYYFAPRSLNYIDYASYEVPQSGIDGEIGLRVPYLSDYCETWVYGGGYYFTDDFTPGMDNIETEDMIGYKGRVEVKPTEWLSLEFEGRDDNVRGTDLYGQVTVEVPFSIENLVAGKNPFEGLKEKTVEPSCEVALADRMYERVQRDPDVITSVSGDTVKNSGVTQSLVYVWGNSPSPTEDGSWANPYKTIAGALTPTLYDPATEAIFVRAGYYVENPVINETGTTLWGQGYKFGAVAMPHALSVSYPILSGYITVNAADVEIAGFDIRTTNNYAIGYTVDPTSTKSSRVYGNRITVHYSGNIAAPVAGIWVNSGTNIGTAANPFMAYGNNIDVDATYSTSGIDHLTAGICLLATNDLFAEITGNPRIRTYAQYIPSGDSNFEIAGVYLDAGAGIGDSLTARTKINSNTIDVSYDIGGNLLSPEGYGIRLDNTTSTDNIYTEITGNTITARDNNQNHGLAAGINVEAGDALFATVTGNHLRPEIAGYNAAGIRLIAGSDIGDATTTGRAIVSTNDMIVFAGIGAANGIVLEALGGSNASDIWATLTGNTLTVRSTSFSATGISLESDDELYATITSNKMTGGILGNSSTGIFIRSYDLVGSTASKLTLTGNTIIAYGFSTGAVGIDLSVTHNDTLAALNATITGNTLTVGNVNAASGDAYGIRANSAGGIFGTYSTNTMTGGICSDTGGAIGISLESSYGLGSPTNKLTLTGNKIVLSGNSAVSDGILLVNDPGFTADLNLTVTGNTIWGDTFGGYIRGIEASTNGGIFGAISSNIMTGGLTAYYTAAGIYLTAGENIGESGNKMSIIGNKIVAAGPYTDSYGIYLMMTGSGVGDGIYCSVSTNTLTVTSEFAYAYGIRGVSARDLFMTATGNTMTGGIVGDRAYGISLTTAYDLGTSADKLTLTSNKITSVGTGGTSHAIHLDSDIDINTTVSGNTLSVASYVTEAGGIWMNADDDLYATITANKTGTGGIAAGNSAVGIYLYAGDELGGQTPAVGELPVTISGNSLVVGADASAWGIYLYGEDYVYANRIKVGSVYYGGIMTNTLTVTSENNTAAGIYVWTGEDGAGAELNTLLATITGNKMAGGIVGNTAYGIYLFAEDYLGTGSDPLTITSNTMKVVTDGGNAYGLYLYARNGTIGQGWLNADVRSNTLTVSAPTSIAFGIRGEAKETLAGVFSSNVMTGGITGNAAYGIYLTGLEVGSDGVPIAVSLNNMKVIADYNTACGIMLVGPDGIYANKIGTAGGILTNTMTVTDNGGNAFGIHCTTDKDLGTEEILATITGNNMLGGITGRDDTAGIYLNSVMLGRSDAYLTVTTNKMKVTGWSGRATGIYLTATSSPTVEGDIYGTITGNTITATAPGYRAYGIDLSLEDQIMGTISSNIMSGGIVARDQAYGIRINTNGEIGENAANPLVVSSNNLKVTSVNSVATGISLYTYNSTDSSDTMWATLNANTLAVTSTNDDATGLYLVSGDHMNARITNNNMLSGITGGRSAWGIYLNSNANGIGEDNTDRFSVTGNRLKVTGNYGETHGIYVYAYDSGVNGNIWAERTGTLGGVYGNTVTVTSGGRYIAYGIEMGASGNLYGTVSGNNLSGGITGYLATGIRLSAYDIGNGTGDPFIMASNNIKITATGDSRTGSVDATGIYLNTNNNFYGTMTSNTVRVSAPLGEDVYGIYGYASNEGFLTMTGTNMSGGIVGRNATGIYLNMSNGFGNTASPLTVSGSTIKVTASGGDACGIDLLSSNDEIYAGYGSGGGILTNSLTVSSADGDAYGIRLYAGLAGSSESLFATIKNNTKLDIDAAGTAVGMYLRAASGNIGNAANPFEISGNKAIDVYSTGGSAAGIMLEANYAMRGNLSTNYLTRVQGLGGTYIDMNSRYSGAVGILLETYGFSSLGIGASGDPMVISGNVLSNVRSTGDSAYGIVLHNENSDIYTEIGGATTTLGNSITVTGGVDGYTEAVGIMLYSSVTGGDTIGSISHNKVIKAISTAGDAKAIFIRAANLGDGPGTDLFEIDHNLGMYAKSLYGSAYGVDVRTNSRIYADISYNNLAGGVTGHLSAYGFSLDSSTSVIGSATPGLNTNITSNTGKIVGVGLPYGTTDAYFLRAFDGSTGSYLNWGGIGADLVGGQNKFTLSGTGVTWSGNYDVGDTLPSSGTGKPVWTNFDASDVLTP